MKRINMARLNEKQREEVEYEVSFNPFALQHTLIHVLRVVPASDIIPLFWQNP